MSSSRRARWIAPAVMLTLVAGVTTLTAPTASAAPTPADFYALSANDGTLRHVSGGTTTDRASGAAAGRQIFLDSHDNLFIADQFNGRVLEVPAGGGATVTRARGLDQPSGVVVDAADNLYVSEYSGRVQKYPAGGGAPVTLANLGQAYEMAIDDTGTTLYVAGVDYSYAIYAVNTDGSGSTTFSSAIETPTGVALGGDGYLYVTDFVAGTLSRMPLSDGNAVDVVASQLTYPTGIDFGSDGNLYLAEAGADRVLAFAGGQGTGTAVTTGLSGPWGVAAAGEPGDKASQSVAFTSTAPDPAAIGGTYEPTATGGASGNPVVFSVDPATTNGACTVDAGVVTFAHAGTCVVAADQAGDGDHAAAETVTQSITVAKDAQSVAFTSTAPAPGSIGGTYTPTATGGASGNPVVFSVDPATTNGACTVDAGVVTFGHAGACVIAADQAGDADRAAGHATQNVTIGKDAQAVAFTSTAPSPAAIGRTYAPAATGGASGNPVVFSVDPATTNSACTVDAGVVTFAHAGACVVAADQAGDADRAAGHTTQTIAVGKDAQSVAFTSTAPAPGSIGATYAPAATGGASGNPVVFSVDPATTNAACTVAAGVVTFAHAGTCVVAADQAGDADRAAGHATQTVTVGKDAQVVTFTSSSPAPGSIGGTYAPTAAGGASGNPVVFSVDPATTNGACTVAAGVVTFAHAGTCVVAADQAGDADRVAGHTTQSIVVAKTAQVVAFTSAAPGSPHVNDSYTPTTTGGSSGQGVQLGVAGPCVLDQGRVTFTDTGVCTITASQAGDSDHRDASPVTQAVTVVRSQPTITAHVSSRRPESRFGWYRRTVTITYTCDADGSTIRGGCPEPVTVRGSGEHRTRTRTIRTADGAVATATTVVDLDKVRPQVRATHVRADRTYQVVPKVGCKATDTLSGIRRCRVRTWVVDHGTRLRYRVTAVDKAGNKRFVKGGVRLATGHSARTAP